MKNLFSKGNWPLVPLFVLYVLTVVFFSSDVLEGDEIRHVDYAVDLTSGYYENADDPGFRNGPGYPIVLAPFTLFEGGLFFAKILNAVFLLFAVVYFKKTLGLFTQNRASHIFVYLIGLYPPVIRWVPFLYSESLMFLVLCALSYHFCKLLRTEGFDRKQWFVTSLLLAFLVLIKIIYLQVVVLALLVVLGVFFWKRTANLKRTTFVLVGSFLWMAPYLAYAYALTGKPFYLGTGGGEILYHRATPYSGEWGNWFSTEDIINGADEDYGRSAKYVDMEILSQHHRDVYLELEDMTHMQKDSVLKSLAIQNMKDHPTKYVKNTIINAGRFVFNYPLSYRAQDPNSYGYMIPNMIILVLWGLSLYPFLKGRIRMPFAIRALMVFALIYACGIVLSAGTGRNFIAMVPVLVLFTAYVQGSISRVVFSEADDEAKV